MNCHLLQFCSCTPADYRTLKERIDLCAQVGRSYEFPHCRLPAGCTPSEAMLGFWRDQSGYQLYFRPQVTYLGNSPRLAALFRGRSTFSTFEDLVVCLLTLEDTPPPARSQEMPMPALFRQLDQLLGDVVVGQEHAVEGVAFKLYGHISKCSPKRPLSLIFYGPTGVGKSELAKGLAPVLSQLCGPYQTVWTELNTFTQSHSVYRLTGAPPGYVGYEDEPIFAAVRQNPKTVFIFDELEKAHPEVLKVFMSILDEGRCTAHREDSTGERELDFRHCVFVFTTNADLSGCTRRSMGFAPPVSPLPQQSPSSAPSLPTGPAELANRLFQEDESARDALVKTGVLREIAGRFSGLIQFGPLERQARALVTARQIKALGREYGLTITQVAPSLAEALTPDHALSLRSTVGVLEGMLTPLFLPHADGERSARKNFALAGTPEHIELLPQGPQVEEPLLPAL